MDAGGAGDTGPHRKLVGYEPAEFLRPSGLDVRAEVRQPRAGFGESRPSRNAPFNLATTAGGVSAGAKAPITAGSRGNMTCVNPAMRSFSAAPPPL
jgi:hypothetical protein